MDTIKIIKKITRIVLVLLGVFLFIYGGYDDSPGAQGLGLALLLVSIWFLLKDSRKLREK